MQKRLLHFLRNTLKAVLNEVSIIGKSELNFFFLHCSEARTVSVTVVFIFVLFEWRTPWSKVLTKSLFLTDNHNKNDMGYKTCAICGRKMYPGEGMYCLETITRSQLTKKT